MLDLRLSLKLFFRFSMSMQEMIAAMTRFHRIVIASALLFFTPAVSAGPINYTFDIVGNLTGIGAMGTFSGEDSDNNNILSREELTSFSIIAVQYNNPASFIEISADDAVINEFSLRLFDFFWSFDVSNGAESGTTGYQAVACRECSGIVGGFSEIRRDSMPSISSLVESAAIRVDQVQPVTPEPSPVPLPATFTLFGLGLLGFRCSKRWTRDHHKLV